MPWRLPLLALLPLLLLASCAPRTEGVALDTRRTPVSLLTQRVRELDSRLHTLTGRGSMSFETPSQGGSASFEVSMRKPDSLLLELEGPFGIGVGTFFLSRQRYVMYNSLENAVASGPPSGSSLRSLLPVNLTYEQMFSAFSGTFPLPDHDSTLSYSVDGDRFLLRYQCEEGTCSYWVDADDLLVRRFEMRDGSGQVFLEGESSGLIEKDGTRIPRRVSISMPQDARRVAIAFSAASINTEDLSFAFTVPSNARKLPLPR
ncbi:MAG TPA: DUF4292 domain-containing protein [Bacteroidota bacterium]